MEEKGGSKRDVGEGIKETAGKRWWEKGGRRREGEGKEKNEEKKSEDEYEREETEKKI